MNQSTVRHTAHAISLECFEVRASFWPDENGGPIHSVLNVSSRGWHAQSPVTADDLRKLAALLTQHAATLDEATAARESLTA